MTRVTDPELARCVFVLVGKKKKIQNRVAVATLDPAALFSRQSSRKVNH